MSADLKKREFRCFVSLKLFLLGGLATRRTPMGAVNLSLVGSQCRSVVTAVPKSQDRSRPRYLDWSWLIDDSWNIIRNRKWPVTRCWTAIISCDFLDLDKKDVISGANLTRFKAPDSLKEILELQSKCFDQLYGERHHQWLENLREGTPKMTYISRSEN